MSPIINTNSTLSTPLSTPVKLRKPSSSKRTQYLLTRRDLSFYTPPNPLSVSDSPLKLSLHRSDFELDLFSSTKASVRRSIIPGMDEDDGDYATLRELPLPPPNPTQRISNGDDTASEEGKVLDFRLFRLAYYICCYDNICGSLFDAVCL